MASVSSYMLHGFNTTCNSLRITPPDRNEFQVTRFRKIKVAGGRCLTETPISAPPSLFSRFRKGARSLVPSIRLVLILLDLVHMLILVSKIIFVSMCNPSGSHSLWHERSARPQWFLFLAMAVAIWRK